MSASPRFDRALVWLRQDLRTEDHAALHHALAEARAVHLAYVFDDAACAQAPAGDRRLHFAHASLQALEAALHAKAAAAGSPASAAPGGAPAMLMVARGEPAAAIPRIAAALGVQAVFSADADEPLAHAQQARARGALAAAGAVLVTMKDDVVFARDECAAPSGIPFIAFAPYRRAWLRRAQSAPEVAFSTFETTRWAAHLAPAMLPTDAGAAGDWHIGVPPLEALGLTASDLRLDALPPGPDGAEHLLADFLARLDDYPARREHPARRGPSYLSTHIRFGCISVRRLARIAFDRMNEGSAAAGLWLDGLIRRDFDHQLMHHHPALAERGLGTRPLPSAGLRGPRAQRRLDAWTAGRTGVPLVDAGMRQLRRTGWQHPRLRALCADFLVRQLEVDWREGAARTAQGLLDFDPAIHTVAWLQAAGLGPDPLPWARVADPVLASRRIDPQGRFIRRYVPELAGLPEGAWHAPCQHPAALAAAGIDPRSVAPLVDLDRARRAAQRRGLQRAAGGGPPRTGRRRTAQTG